MRVHFYISAEEIDKLKKLIKGEDLDPVKIQYNSHADWLMISISYDEYVKLTDSEKLLTIIAI